MISDGFKCRKINENDFGILPEIKDDVQSNYCEIRWPHQKVSMPYSLFSDVCY
jgi:hypothetical protein